MKTTISRITIDSTNHASHTIPLWDNVPLKEPFYRNIPNASYTAQLGRAYRNVISVRLVDFSIPHTDPIKFFLDQTLDPAIDNAFRIAVPSLVYVDPNLTVNDLDPSTRQLDMDTATRILRPWQNAAFVTERIQSTFSYLEDDFDALGGFVAYTVNGEFGNHFSRPTVYNRFSIEDNDEIELVGSFMESVEPTQKFLVISEFQQANGSQVLQKTMADWQQGKLYRVGDKVRGTSVFGTPGQLYKCLESHYSNNYTNEYTTLGLWETTSQSGTDVRNVFASFFPPSPAGGHIELTPNNVRAGNTATKFRQPINFNSLTISWLDNFANPAVFPIVKYNDSMGFRPHVLVLEVTELDDGSGNYNPLKIN